MNYLFLILFGDLQHANATLKNVSTHMFKDIPQMIGTTYHYFF
jgi:hypothetical protein